MTKLLKSEKISLKSLSIELKDKKEKKKTIKELEDKDEKIIIKTG